MKCPIADDANISSAHKIFLLGRAYNDGLCGYPVDKKKSKQAYISAAEKNDSEAQYALGEIYFTGDGETPNYLEAKRWYLQAAAHGEGRAALRLGFLFAENHFTGLTPNLVEAEKWFRIAAEKQVGDAEFRLGNFYSNYKIPRDDAQAFLWLTRAAEGGHRIAMFDLGRLYLAGKGTKKDNDKALKWLEKAAEANVLQAQILLCHLYESGDGITASPTQFVKWMLRIADAPSASTYWINRAGDGFFAGEYGLTQNYPKARHYYERAMRKGDAHASQQLAIMHKEGLGFARDEKLAKDYLNRRLTP